MRSRRHRWTAALLGGAILAILPAAGKRDPFSITFHLQGEENEGRFVMPDPESPGLYFRLAPEVSHLQMTAFYPFLSADGRTYGAVFTLNEAGGQRLSTLEASASGKLLRSVVNGRPVDYLQIDRGGDWDEIVIWHGLTEADFKLFEKKLPRGRFADRR